MFDLQNGRFAIFKWVELIFEKLIEKFNYSLPNLKVWSYQNYEHRTNNYKVITKPKYH